VHSGAMSGYVKKRGREGRGKERRERKLVGEKIK
jgi:hypothetical protein